MSPARPLIDESVLQPDIRVSVAIFIYNHEAYIQESLQSVLMQRTNFKYEIVIGDDCSTDQSGAILERYAAEYPDKIRLIRRPKNIGMNRNFIETLRACRGEFIALLDGDDYWIHPEKLHKQVDFLLTHPECAGCFHNAFVGQRFDLESMFIYPGKGARTVGLDDLWLSNPVPTAACMVRARLVEEPPEWFYELILGDLPLLILIARFGNFGYLTEIMSFYRAHSGGAWTSTSAERRFLGLIEMHEHFLKDYRVEGHKKKIMSAINYQRYQLACCLAHRGDVAGFKKYARLWARHYHLGDQFPIGGWAKNFVCLFTPRLHKFLNKLRTVVSARGAA